MASRMVVSPCFIGGINTWGCRTSSNEEARLDIIAPCRRQFRSQKTQYLDLTYEAMHMHTCMPRQMGPSSPLVPYHEANVSVLVMWEREMVCEFPEIVLVVCFNSINCLFYLSTVSSSDFCTYKPPIHSSPCTTMSSLL
jgi:hypothetical protein